MTQDPRPVPGLTRRRLIAAGGTALAAPALIRPAGAQARKAIRISTPGNEVEWQGQGLMKFKELVEAQAPGLEVQLFFNATLFDQGTEIPAMQRGNLEVGLISPQDVASYIPEYSLFTAGYLLRDPEHLHKVYDDSDVAEEYRARVASELEVTILAAQYLGTRHVILRRAREVMTPADMAGLKLRVPGSETWQFLGRALGATPTPIAFDEVYLALSTGTVDGMENPIPDMIAAKFHEVSEQVVLTAHMVAPLFFGIATSFWNGLTDEEKAVVAEAARAQARLVDEGTMATEAEGVELLESFGLKVTMPDRDAFREHVQRVYLESDYAKDWPAGLIDRINAL